MEFDLLIRNAKIMDGTGNPWYFGDLGVDGERIVAIGNLKDARGRATIDADKKVLAPGFIDSHTHVDLGMFHFLGMEDPYFVRRLEQGITSQIAGCCGIGPAPVLETNKADWLGNQYGIREPDRLAWHSFGEYLDEVERFPLGTNYASYVGHGPIRHAVLGFSDRSPSAGDLDKMKDILRQALEDGALGMSTGLIYPPGFYSSTEELVELSSVLGEFGAIYASHLRSESRNWLEAVEEAIEIGERNNIALQLHHIKVKHEDSRKLVQEFLEIIEEKRKGNLDISFDLYPYTASATGLTVILPDWVFEGGEEKVIERIQDKKLYNRILKDVYSDYGWKTLEDEEKGCNNMLILDGENCHEYRNKTVYEISREKGIGPVAAALEILLETKLTAGTANFGIEEEDIKSLLKSPYTMIGADAGAAKLGGHVHPRNNGTFPRILGKYAREEGVISMEEAINKMTGFPAARFNFQKRGLIKEGFYADLVIFDEEKIRDRASYIEPFKSPVGIEYVIVNGCISIENGRFTDRVGGKVLRRHN